MSVRSCAYLLESGRQCGLPAEGASSDMCVFHRLVGPDRRFSTGVATAVREYVRQNEVNSISPIDFRQIRFHKLLFTNNELPGTLRFVFDGATFEGCIFRECELLNVSFARGCRFINTQFLNCRFGGNTCDFSTVTFDCVSVPFEECDFSLERDGEIGASTLEFKDCRGLLGEELFHSCSIDADIVVFDRLRLRGKQCKPSLEIWLQSEKCTTAVPMLCLVRPTIISLNGIELNGTFTYKQFPRVSGQQSDPIQPRVLLSGVDFGKMESAQFLDAHLENVYFQRSWLESVKFHSCTWRTENGYRCLRDDESAEYSRAVDFSELIRLYVQLKKNFESNRNYIEAGDWFYREMEVRRSQLLAKKTGFRRLVARFLSFTSLYKWVSNYGESYRAALVRVLSVWALFAPLYFFTGFTLGRNTLNYDFCWKCGLHWTQVIDLMKALVFSGAVMTLQIGRVASLPSHWSEALFLVQLVLTACLIPLFLLAVRRKFRRKSSIKGNAVCRKPRNFALYHN